MLHTEIMEVCDILITLILLQKSCLTLKYLSTPLALTPPPLPHKGSGQGLGTPLVTARPAHGRESPRHNSPILTIRHMHA